MNDHILLERILDAMGITKPKRDHLAALLRLEQEPDVEKVELRYNPRRYAELVARILLTQPFSNEQAFKQFLTTRHFPTTGIWYREQGIFVLYHQDILAEFTPNSQPNTRTPSEMSARYTTTTPSLREEDMARLEQIINLYCIDE